MYCRKFICKDNLHTNMLLYGIQAMHAVRCLYVYLQAIRIRLFTLTYAHMHISQAKQKTKGGMRLQWMCLCICMHILRFLDGLTVEYSSFSNWACSTWKDSSHLLLLHESEKSPACSKVCEWRRKPCPSKQTDVLTGGLGEAAGKQCYKQVFKQLRTYTSRMTKTGHNDKNVF